MPNELIQDWTDYNQSAIFDITSDYYKEMGIDAYSYKVKKHAIPHAVTNCFPHAHSIVNLVKVNLEKNYPENKKITVLECGAGSGLFAKHFLNALEKLEILDRVEYIISDYSNKALEHIKEKNILEGFEENKHYKFMELDLLNLDKSKFPENISVSILNYVLDALPLTILRLNHNETQSKYEELQVKLSKNLDIKTNDPSYLENLNIEQKWVAYDDKSQSETEKKYIKSLDKFAQIVPEQHIYYNYASIEAINNLLEITDENGFIFAADMPPIKDRKDTFEVYGNTVAHPVNDNLLALELHEHEVKSIRCYDHLLLRMLIMKNPYSEEFFQNSFSDEYIKNNDTNVYIDLRKAINQIQSPHSGPVFDFLIKQFAVLDNYSCETFLFLGKFCEFMGSYKQAFEFYEKADKLDYLGNYNISENVSELKAKI